MARGRPGTTADIVRIEELLLAALCAGLGRAGRQVACCCDLARRDLVFLRVEHGIRPLEIALDWSTLRLTPNRALIAEIDRHVDAVFRRGRLTGRSLSSRRRPSRPPTPLARKPR